MKRKFHLVEVFFLKNRLTGYRLVYLFVGHGRKIGKFPCSWCRLANLTNR